MHGLVLLRVGPGATATTILLLLVLPDVLRRNSLHAVDLDRNVGPIRQRVWHLIDRFLVHLHTVDGQPGTGVEFLVADVTLEVLGLLMLHQNLLVIEFTIAVPGRSGGKIAPHEGGTLS